MLLSFEIIHSKYYASHLNSGILLELKSSSTRKDELGSREDVRHKIDKRKPKASCRSKIATMSFDNALWKAVFTGIASNTNAAITVTQIEADSSEKTTWCNQLTRLYVHEPIADAAVDGLPAAANETTLDEHVPIVNSFTVWKMCEGLDLKTKFVLLQDWQPCLEFHTEFKIEAEKVIAQPTPMDEELLDKYNKYNVLAMSAEVTEIHAMRSFTELPPYRSDFRWFQKKKSKGLNFGERGD
ncbi:hypothetical protein TNCV_4977021 [Trichonephila clavipes]|nr:hypothetical protein TNCV_4977021 [Trichonephila clavipes]